jgi:hypothetical integral membrane protein (TIGR02206 family)
LAINRQSGNGLTYDPRQEIAIMTGGLFERDYTGAPFMLFGREHIIALILVAGICLLVYLFRGFWTEHGMKATRWGLCALIYLCEGSWQVWMWAIGAWTIQGMLPLWLCSVTSWTMPLLLLFRRKWYYEWVYFMGIIGASMALLTPDLAQYGFPHFRFMEFFTLHGAIIVAIVYMTVVEGFRPTGRAIPRVVVITNLFWAFCALVNIKIGSQQLSVHTGKAPHSKPVGLFRSTSNLSVLDGIDRDRVVPVVISSIFLA